MEVGIFIVRVEKMDDFLVEKGIQKAFECDFHKFASRVTLIGVEKLLCKN